MPSGGGMFYSQEEFGSLLKELIPVLSEQSRSKFTTMFFCVSAFVGGALALLLVEVVLVVLVVLRITEKRRSLSSSSESSQVKIDVPENSNHFKFTGTVWVAALPPGDVRKMYTKREKALKETSKEQKGDKASRGEKTSKEKAKDERNDEDKGLTKEKSKKDKDVLKGYIQVAPVRREARLDGRTLHLSCQGVQEEILLEGCEILAVSSSDSPSRKWAKRYPLKVHNDRRHVYGGSHDCLIYLETGWEKESWCAVLRASACWTKDTADWYVKMKEDYVDYTHRVEGHFPFLKLGNFPYEESQGEKNQKGELAAGNKKRQLWNKLRRKSIKKDGKFGERDETQSVQSDGEGSSGRGVRTGIPPRDQKIARTGSLNDLNGRKSSKTMGSGRIGRTSSTQPDFDLLSTPAPLDQSYTGEGESMERALFCGDLLFARLFFDLYHSTKVADRLQNLLQRQLNKLPVPSYMGSFKCTQFDLGNSPPLAHRVQSLPLDADGCLGLEADVQYFGGATLTIETRIDLRDTNARDKAVFLEQTLAGAATAEFLTQGLEGFKTDFHNAEEEGGTTPEQRNASGPSTSKAGDVRALEEGMRKSWMQSPLTNLKAMMSRVAEHVSQVPLALTIRVVQINGRLRIRMKPPPSDRMWFSFTEPPILDIVPEPCIGERKINSGPVGAVIINQIKTLINNVMVSPQCEDLPYPWMISEEDNWIERHKLPLQFSPDYLQSDQSVKKEKRETQMGRQGSIDTKLLDASGVGPSKSLAGTSSQSTSEDFGSSRSSSQRVSVPSVSLDIVPVCQNDLTQPLLQEFNNDTVPEETDEELESAAISLQVPESQAVSSSDSDTGFGNPDEKSIPELQNSLRVSKRDRVRTFGKRMGSRLDEKRRQVVDKMRERDRDRSQAGSQRVGV